MRIEPLADERARAAIDGTPVGPCRQVDGLRTADASGILLAPTAFPAIALWCLVPPPVAADAALRVVQ